MIETQKYVLLDLLEEKIMNGELPDIYYFAETANLKIMATDEEIDILEKAEQKFIK